MSFTESEPGGIVVKPVCYTCQCESIRIMTLRAIRSQPANVRIRMATRAGCVVDISKLLKFLSPDSRYGMALCACHFGVRTPQREIRITMIEPRSWAKRFGIVTFYA